MSFNGSGTFLINSTGQPVVANTVISATVFNALTADLASGLTNCITKDGQTTPTSNIPMGSNKITGLANGTLASDAATLGQVQTTVAKLITSVSGADTVTGIMSPTLTAYAAGQLFYYVAVGANTGAVTLNIDGLGAKSVTRDGASALAAGDINSGEVVVVIYDGTRFQMINAANSFGNTTINGTLTVTGNTGLQANVSITSTLSVGGTFAVTGAATLGSTLAVTGKSDLPTVSTASVNAAVAVITTATVTNLTATSASVASVNAGVALLTTATVTNLTASGASIASANIGNLQFTAASIASINAGVAVVTNLTATSASIASANVGTAVITTGTVTNLTSTSASIASANAAVALVTTGTVTNLTSTAASIASANLGNAVVTTLTATGASVASANAGVANVSDLRVVGASVTSANIGTALVTRLDVTGASAASINAGVALVTTGTVTNLTSTSASIASANAGTAVVTNLTATGASIASVNVGTGVVTTLTATQASVGSINAAVALVTNGTVTTLSGTQASITSINHAVVRLLGSSSGYVGLQGAAAAGSTTYTLPSADGTNGQVLATNGSGTLSWASAGGGGTGDVVGPASATDNAITRFDQTTGKLIQNSTVILDDAGTITGVAALAAVTVSVTSANAGTATITSGNLTFSSTGQRITGDMANATLTNRLAFQNSVTNANTPVNAIPNGTGTGAGFRGYGASDPTNAPSVSVFQIGTTDSRIASEINGTASYTPLTFYTGGSERMRLSTTGELGLGIAAPTIPLQIGKGGGGNPATSGTTQTYGIARIGSSGVAALDVGAYAAGQVWMQGVNVTNLANNFDLVLQPNGGNVGIGGTADGYAKTQIRGTLPTASTISVGCSNIGVVPSGSTGAAYYYSTNLNTQAASFTCANVYHYYTYQNSIGAGSTVTNQYGYFADATLTGATNNYGFYSNIASGSNRYNFYAAGTANNYFAGNALVAKTVVDDNTAGIILNTNGTGSFVRSGGIGAYINRLTSDGDLIVFAQDTTTEGSISVSGNTVSYNAFAGSHWSQLQDNSKPDILRGTVMESINELCVWPDEQNERLPKSKISDTAGSKKVYGVFMAWDNDWTATNDMLVTSVGAFVCRVNSSVTVQEGDLLESNGDGTARVQADDIIRSSTIGKVTSTVKTHQYADGSYCVPTVLYCG